jgi:hypothetical protein
MKWFLIVLPFCWIAAVCSQEASPGRLYYELATKPTAQGGFGMSGKEAIDWTLKLPKTVVFNFESFNSNFVAALKERGTNQVKEAIEIAVDRTKQQTPENEERPRTLAEASEKNGDDFALLSSVREKTLRKFENPYDIKTYEGFSPNPFGGLGEYYYIEQRLTPRTPGSDDDASAARIGVGVYSSPFGYYNCWGWPYYRRYHGCGYHTHP